MILYVGIAGAVLLGGLIGAVAAYVPGRPPRRVLAFGAVCILSIGLYCPMLYCFAKVSHLPFSREAIFPDAISVLVGVYIYLLVALAAGFFLGCVRARGVRRYFSQAFRSGLHKKAFMGFLVMNIIFALAGIGSDDAILMRSTTLRITEICAHNFNLRADPSGDCPDYIELYNYGTRPVDLAGFYLSDDKDRPGKCALPELKVPAGGTVLAWANNSEPTVVGENEIALNFRLSDGEQVCLSLNGRVILETVEVSSLPDNVALTLTGAAWTQAYGTPGLPNDDAAPYVPSTLEKPQFSLPGGFYEEPVTVEITAEAGCSVYYTLDSSIPDTDAQLYQGPITLEDVSSQPNRIVNAENVTRNWDISTAENEPVDKGTILRAVAVDSRGVCGPVATAAYFVGDFSDYRGQAVLSIVSDPDDLFGEKGICVTGPAYDAWAASGSEGEEPAPNFSRRGRLWERPASVQVWDGEGALRMEDDCGIRLQGNTSRGYPRKRFSLLAREYYSGSDVFSAPVFGEKETHSFFLREDSYDFMAQALLEDRSLGTLGTIPVTVFLDGELYYTAYMRERYDGTYFQSHFGVDPDNVILISEDEVDIGEKEDYLAYQDFLAYIQESDAADPRVYAEIQRQMDIQSYIDFVCANLYCNNIDWSFYKNYKLWRTRAEGGMGYEDGRWRWLAYDMDAIGWAGENLEQPIATIDTFHCTEPFVQAGHQLHEYIDAPIFSDLLQNREFRQQFALSYLDMMNVNFNFEHVLPLLKQYGLETDGLWPGFLRERPAYAVQYLIDALELPGAPCQVVLSVSDPKGGSIAINTTTADTASGSCTGTYISGLPITLTAKPAPGWVFVGWQGSAESAQEQLTVPLTGKGVSLTAVFAPTAEG